MCGWIDLTNPISSLSLFFSALSSFTNVQYDKIVIGGVDQPSVRRQVNGFGSGVKIACSTCIAYGLYSGTFESDPKLIKTVADLLTDKKVSVVFNAASIFGTLTLKNLTTQQGIYAIGSGSDEWVTNWAYGSVPGSEHVLTSVQTDYTVLVRSVVQSVLRANLTGGGTVFYGVNKDMRQSAIKLAPAHEAGGVFTKEVEEKMRGYVRDMTVGKLSTGVDHKSGYSRSSGSCKYLFGCVHFGVDDGSLWLLFVLANHPCAHEPSNSHSRPSTPFSQIASTSVQLLPLTDKPSSSSSSSSPSSNNNSNKSTDTDENTISSSRKSHASSNKDNLDRLGRLFFTPTGLFIACMAIQTIELICLWMVL